VVTLIQQALSIEILGGFRIMVVDKGLAVDSRRQGQDEQAIFMDKVVGQIAGGIDD
jgi:hypothetical protein